MPEFLSATLLPGRGHEYAADYGVSAGQGRGAAAGVATVAQAAVR